MSDWEKVSEGYYRFEDDSWTLYLRADESGAMLEVYYEAAHVSTNNWGPGTLARTGVEWCMKQSLKFLEAEKKKRK